MVDKVRTLLNPICVLISVIIVLFDCPRKLIAL